MMAAIAAAEEGAGVLVVEGDRTIGGTGVRASVHHYYYGSAGGLQNAVDQRVRHKTKLLGSSVHGFQPEAKRAVVAEMMRQLGIRVLYNAVVAEALLERNRLVGAIIETVDSTIEVRAEVAIDCTGDGDLAYLAGVPYTLGREWDGAMHPYSIIPRFVDEEQVKRYTNFDAGWTDPTDVRELSRAYISGRQYAWKPGEDARTKHYTEMSAQIGIRESRYMIGEYVLQHEDLVLDRRFDDCILHCSSHYDNHAYDYANESKLAQLWVAVCGLHGLRYGGDIPYRCIVPLEVDGLLVGCRALSADRDAAIAMRMQRDMHKLGEAAGVAAALCVKQAANPRDLNVAVLQQRLIARGVLGPDARVRESKPTISIGRNDSAQSARFTNEQASDPAAIDAYIACLGAEDEGKALWWLWHIGSGKAVPALKKALPQAEGTRLRGIAFALALHGEQASVPVLLETIRSRDADKPGGNNARTAERWLAAFIVLKWMRCKEAITDAIRLLGSDQRSGERLHVLHYMIAVADQLDDTEKSAMAASIQSMLAEPELGDDYKLWGVNTHDTKAGSIKWSLEMTGGYALELIGYAGLPAILKYADDPRAHARTAAKRMLARLKERGSVHASV
ncbi:MAG: hypothetical protein K0Q59_387 [Paenibacillus sp.]|nr:hypothetical protein [Paenibacillus sp.]